MTTTQETPVEQLTSGLGYREREDGIIEFIFTDMTRHTVDVAFSKIVENDRLAHQAGQHIRTIYNIRGHWIISPHLISRAISVANDTPKDLVESIAVVGDKLTIRVLGGVVRRLTSKVRSSIRVFTTESSAIDWLHERDEYLDTPPYIGIDSPEQA